MARKHYTPRLLVLLRTLCHYIRRYEDSLRNFLDGEGDDLLTAVITACEAMEEFLTAIEEVSN